MNLIGIIGMTFFLLGMSIYLLGKKFFVLRLFFGDRSVIFQVIWGTIVSILGLVIMYLSGTFS